MKSCFVNVYIVHRRYGGPEEGGWWYSEGYPLAFVDVTGMDDYSALKIHDTLKIAFNKQYPKDNDICIDVHTQNHRAKHFPTYRPHYE